MWPFNGEKWKYMVKVTLTDGQEFVGEDRKAIFRGPVWIRINLDDKAILYPLHRVQDVRTWREKKC